MSIVFEHVAHTLRAQLHEDAEVRGAATSVVILMPVGHSVSEGAWYLAAKLEKLRYVYRLRIGRVFMPRIDPFEGGTFQVARTFFVAEGRYAKIQAHLLRPLRIRLREEQHPLRGGPDFSQATGKVWQALKIAVST